MHRWGHLTKQFITPQRLTTTAPAAVTAQNLQWIQLAVGAAAAAVAMVAVVTVGGVMVAAAPAAVAVGVVVVMADPVAIPAATPAGILVAVGAVAAVAVAVGLIGIWESSLECLALVPLVPPPVEGKGPFSLITRRIYKCLLWDIWMLGCCTVIILAFGPCTLVWIPGNVKQLLSRCPVIST